MAIEPLGSVMTVKQPPNGAYFYSVVQQPFNDSSVTDGSETGKNK